VLGTRPEIIKLAPVVSELRKRRSSSVKVLFTGQHPDLGTHFLREFDIEPDVILEPGSAQGPRLPHILTLTISEITRILSSDKPDAIIVQGDTISALSGAIAGFLNRTPVMHVEAGLRTSDVNNPFPEEWNRRLIDQSSSLFFAPTPSAKTALEREGHDANLVSVTGNTGIDAVRFVLESEFGQEEPPLDIGGELGDYILLTLHRGELWDKTESVQEALLPVIEAFRDYRFIAIDHPNGYLRRSFRGINAPNLTVIPPQPFRDFISLLAKCALIISDSGGIQEEATYLCVPLLILRENTERSEALVSPNSRIRWLTDDLIDTVRELVGSNRQEGIRTRFAFGDGYAALQIVDILDSYL